jgi:hypothetical protein
MRPARRVLWELGLGRLYPLRGRVTGARPVGHN